MTSNYLVTGGAGFIGSFVVEELLARGKNVTVLDNFSSGSKENLTQVQKIVQGRLRVLKGDIRKLSDLEKVCRGISVVYHMAVQPLTLGLEDPLIMNEVNSTGTLNTLHAAHLAGIQRFNYISSSEVYGTAQYVPMDENHPRVPLTVYAASKLAGEAYVQGYYNTYGLTYTIIRPFNSYGPRHRDDGYCAVLFRFLQCVIKNEPPQIYGDGKQTRDMSYVEDTARGIVLAGESPRVINDVVNIGTGREVQVNEVAQAVLEILGSKLKPRKVAPRPGDVRRHLAGIAKAQYLLGYKPRFTFAEGVLKTIEWYLQKHSKR